MKRQRAGNFRERVEIQQDSSAAGQSVPDYTGTPKWKSVPCSITSLSGYESWRGRQLEAHRSHVIECHYIEGVTSTMRARVLTGVYRGALLNVDNVRVVDGEGPRYRTLEIFCTEVPSG